MTLRNTPTRWGSVARFLHWFIALGFVTVFTVGLVMGDVPLQDRRYVYAMHKSFGLLVLAFVLVRILWRLTSKAPDEISSIPKPMQLMAKLGHLGLYALMLAVPFSGWLVHSLSGFTTNWFYNSALPTLPMLTAPAESRDVVEQVGGLHGLLAWGIAALVVVHAAAAFYHHFIRKDATLARMVPFMKDPR